MPDLDESEFDQMSRIRDRLYRMVSDNPSGPDAERARGLLARMPKSDPRPGNRMPAAKPDEVGDIKPPLADRALAATARGAQVGVNATSNAVDAATLGYYRKARNAVGNVVAPEATASAQAMEQEAESEPVGQFVGGMGRGVGYLTGAPSLLAKGVSTGLRAATNAAPKAIGRVLGARPVAGAVTGGATGATLGGSEAAAQGGDMEEIKRAALASGIGGAFIGGGIGTVAAAGGKIADKLAQNPRAQLIERHGGKISPSSPGEGGAFDDPLISGGLSERGKVTDAGIGKTARAAARQVRESLNTENKAGVGIHKAKVNKLREDGALEGQHDVTSLAEQAQKMADDIENFTADTRSKVSSEILPVLEKYKREDGSYLATPDQLNALRKKIVKVANFQTRDGVVKDKDIGRLARVAKDLVGETALAEPNAEAAARVKSLQKAHRGLNIQGNSRSSTAPDDMAAEKTLTDLITRRGQNTVTAGKYETPELAEAVAQRPELQLPLDSAALLRARGAMQFFGGGKHGGLIERLKNPIGSVMQAAEPIGQRLVRPVAERAAALDPSPARLLSLPEAIRRGIEAKRRRDMENQR